MTSEFLEFKEIVERKCLNELEVFAAARGKSNIHESLLGTADQISVSYKGRTLIELIQNGYDPHSPDRNDGEIAVLLNLAEGDHGCLYVANRGAGFTHRNFEGLCDIARSSKVVNQGIGNKGFGFRSVRQICKYPEIYSAASSGSAHNDFDGFCFVFPDDSRLREVLSQTEYATYADEIIRIMPRSLLPIFTSDRPGHVPRFANEGFSTVIRMPLDRQDAASDVRDQIDAICDAELPIQLFLRRLDSIRIEIAFEDADSDEDEFSRQLQRKVIERWASGDVLFELVRIDADNGFVVSTSQLPDNEFRPVLDAGIISEELPESWKEWKDAAEVSIAVPLDGSGNPGRLYNFLPMESAATSPCAAHVNAPFLCDIDRKKLVEDVELNEYFLNELADLCLSTADNIRQSHPDIAPKVVVDATMWLDGHTNRMTRAAKSRSDSKFEDLPLIPTTEKVKTDCWTTLRDAYAWPSTLEKVSVFSADIVGQISEICFVASSIQGRRLERIVDVAKEVTGATLSPTNKTMANWAEQVAANLNKRNVSIEIWNGFYADLTTIFEDSPDVLNGRQILLTNDGKLVSTLVDNAEEESAESGRRRRLATRGIFLPSTRPTSGSGTETEDIDDSDEPDMEEELRKEIPRSLGRYIQMVNQNLACSQRIDESGARQFLVNNRLVNRFQLEDILRLLANLTARPGGGKNPDKRRKAALQLALELASRGQRKSDLTDMPFRIPNRNGQWIRASRAYFGNSWEGTRGKELAELIDQTSTISKDHEDVAKNTLGDLKKWFAPNESAKEWTRFLIRLGVKDRLRFRNIRPRGRLVSQGISLKSTLLDRCDIEESALDYWSKELPSEIRNPYTEYTVRERMPFFPGQSEYDQFSPKARAVFARELIASLQDEDESILTIHVLRPGRLDSNDTYWPSPVASFLRQAPWLPIQEIDSECTFSKPADAWHLPFHTSMGRPDFLSTITGDVRAALESRPAVCQMLQEHCGLNVVNSGKSSLAQVRLLGGLAASTSVAPPSSAAFDSLYAAAWDLVSGMPDALSEYIDSPTVHLAAHQGAEIVGQELLFQSTLDENSATDELVQAIYFADDVTPTTRDLLKELGRPIFDFKFKNRAALAPKLCNKFVNLQPISAVKLEVFIEGQRFTPTASDQPLISADRRWLQDAILVVCDLTAGFLNLGPTAFEKLRAQLTKLQYLLVSEIELEIDGSRMPLPEFAQGCMLYNDLSAPTVLVETDQSNLSWSVLQQASHAIAEGLGYPIQLSTVLASAFAQLAQLHGPDALDRPDVSDLQAVCRKGRQTVEESVRNLRHVTASLIELARPVIHMLAPTAPSGHFDNAANTVDNEDDFVALLEEIESDIPVSAAQILEACRRNEEIDGVRRDLNLDVAEFNQTLTELGPPYRELNFDEDHRLQFRYFIKEREARIFESIRAAYLSTFDAGKSLDAYLGAREFVGLSRDRHWATAFDKVPDDLVTDQINAWLQKHNAQPLNEDPKLINSKIADCRSSNQEIIRQLATEAWPVLSAWCRTHSVTLPEPWRSAAETQRSLPRRAYEQGWIDFRILDRDALVHWLARTDNWPEGMPETLDESMLGIDLDAINTEIEQAEQRKLEAARQAKIVHVGNRELMVDQVDISDALNRAIQDYRQNESLFETPARLTQLDKLDSKAKTKKKSGSTQNTSHRSVRDLPAEQKKLVGLLGERIAFEWLQSAYPKAVTEENWVSKNRELALQTGAGNDSLGYDFYVTLPNYKLYFEVKATTTDDPFFRLGPTEVEAAIKCRADGKRRFRILFIQRATDPGHAKISLLPNPYSNQHKDRFQLVTKGEQGFRFDPGVD